MPWNPPADTRPGGPGWADGRGWGEGRGWSGRRPRGTIWFPVVLSVLFQLPGVFIAAHAAATDPLTLAAVLVAFASSFLLLLARAYPGPVLVAIAALCTP